MASMNVAVVGGGSVNWMPKLMKGFFNIEEIDGGEIRLVDPNKEHAELVVEMIKVLNKKQKKDFKVLTIKDRKEAFNNADLVWTTFSPGTLDAFWNDLEIPKKYGVHLPMSMTTGPGGLSAALRTVPVAYEIVKDMEEVCPGAWILNETNPMYAVVKAMNMASKTVKIIGMCHEFHGHFPELVEEIFDIKKPEGMTDIEFTHYWLPENGFEYTVAGINHFIFLIRVSLNGEDMMPRVREYAKNHWKLGVKGALDIHSQRPLNTDSNPFKHRSSASLSLGRRLGYLSICGDRETVEHIPSLCNYHNGWGMKYGVWKTSLDRRRIFADTHKKELLEIINTKDNTDIELKHEQMADIIKAIINKSSTKCMINTPNRGQIANLPEDIIVETEATVLKDKIKPESAGDLPEVIRSFCRLHSDVRELVIKAALEGSRQKFVEALCLEPMNYLMDLDEIGYMADELLEANREWLPRFFK